MTQLIKLRDFISRYETDIYRYPSQYIRLKKERWKKIKMARHKGEGIVETMMPEQKNQSEYEKFEGFENFDENWLEDEKKGFLGTIKEWFSKKNGEIDVYDIETSFNEETMFSIDLNKSEEEIKQEFLDELFRFQLNWASSTIRDQSFLGKIYFEDEVLKYFLQHFPDNYLLLYKPTIIVKKATIDLEIILISPVMTYCISLVESENMSVFVTHRGRYWFENFGEEGKKRINPLPALQRTESIVQSFYKHYNVELPIKKVVLSRTGYIEGEYEPVNTLIIDKRNYSEWYSRLRRLPSPIKFVQLKAAQSLLKHCQATYIRRREWETDSEDENEYI